MNTKISLKKTWVQRNSWRGYYEPIFWVAGANDTGMFDDSPCPSVVTTKELKMVKKLLRRYGIRFREVPATTSNLFCIHRYLVVSEADHEEACKLVSKTYDEELKPHTRLLYVNYGKDDRS